MDSIQGWQENAIFLEAGEAMNGYLQIKQHTSMHTWKGAVGMSVVLALGCQMVRAQEEQSALLDMLESRLITMYDKEIAIMPNKVRLELSTCPSPHELGKISADSQLWIKEHLHQINEPEIALLFDKVYEIRCFDDVYQVASVAFWRRANGKPLDLEARIEEIELYHKESQEPSIRFAPVGGGEVMWMWKLPVNSRPYGVLHIGIDTNTRRFLCYEQTKGLYYPEGEVLERIRAEIVQEPLMAGRHLGKGLKDAKRKFFGTYRIASAERDGTALDMSKFRDMKVVISDDAITVFDANSSVLYTASYQINGSTVPIGITLVATITANGTLNGIPARGLIERTGETIRLIYALPGGEAPIEFKSGPKQNLFVLSDISGDEGKEE